MAISQNTLIGRTRNSVGGVTFTTWKGLNVIKSKAISVANPKTPAQLLQRARLTLMVAIYRLIATPIQTGFNPQAIGKSEYNAWMGENLNNATTGTTASNVAFAPDQCVMSKGSIGQPSSFGVDDDGGGSAEFTWNTDVPVGGSADDTAVMIVFNETLGTWSSSVSSVLRSAGTAVISAPSGTVSGNTMHGYLFFKSASSNEVSDSETDSYTQQ